MKNKRNLILALTLLFLCVVALGAASVWNHSTGTTPVTREEFMFDTVLELSIYDKMKEEQMSSVFEQVYARSQEIEDEFSVFQKDSLAEMINGKAAEEEIAINDDFNSVLQTAMKVSKLSKGAFDITVKPLSDLWNFNSPSPAVPSPNDIYQAKAKVGYQNILLSDHSIRFQNAGIQIEFGAVAKGFAVEEAAEQLRKLGVQKAIVNYGGNVALVGEKESGKGYSVGLQTPFSPTGEYFALLRLSNCALATSGAYERNFTVNGTLYHHILDPKTGYPAESGLKSVTVVCEDAAKADALSTAFFVMGFKDSMDVLDSLEGVDAVFVDDLNRVYITNGLKDKISITDEAYRLEREE
jgi:thiamine biosynthesis lipoprotein